MQISFKKTLLQWHQSNKRRLPWKNTNDPFKIWLSEIILQQTRIEQGTPYYLKFVERFPNVEALAAAGIDEIMVLWEGLGYYSRARNMHKTAKLIVRELNGNFPKSFTCLLKLKGVGPYSAAAIASFAFQLPHAVVDGNVLRVLARVFGIEPPIDSAKGKKQFSELAGRLMDRKNPGEYNQAIMDFGAMVCKPVKPACGICPFSKDCKALASRQVLHLPVKTKKIVRKKRYFNYLVASNSKEIIIQKRVSKDIWNSLYEFPLIESDGLMEEEEFYQTEKAQKLLPGRLCDVSVFQKDYKQALTHQEINARFFEVNLESFKEVEEAKLLRIAPENLNNFAFPKIVSLYLADKTLNSTNIL